ncbi:hypothetical protein DUF421 [Gottschalkia acidurici 9a]|uniref:Transcriptional regulator n=1 Tax=Gottschalkia acidurici (strain ATCC 7906 / DSM 604 / BCRC 14475 / CIP 104303 / KCTC 5404 / NCIMB 10678 / 9a) TaxID=1128398 RepID=K0AYN6_GOTA9|nr:AIM24 family protein [Gottschalkia acidurici]AFS77840.1 hypothetical protein DUF421 [Gottschalkia acidurici 9a]
MSLRKNLTVAESLKSDGINIEVLEYDNLTATNAQEAENIFYMNKAGVKLRQCCVTLDGTRGVQLSSGAMSFMKGDIDIGTNVKGVGDFLGKFVSSKVTGEKAIKPLYKGVGEIYLEPSYKHFILHELKNESICMDDGMFFAAGEGIKISAKPIQRLSAAVAGGEGLFNLCAEGSGPLLLESKVPLSEILVYNLVNDTLKVDGNFVVLWSSSLEFTVQKSTKSLIGSAASGEGLVNVYKGTGTVWLAPTLKMI